MITATIIHQDGLGYIYKIVKTGILGNKKVLNAGTNLTVLVSINGGEHLVRLDSMIEVFMNHGDLDAETKAIMKNGN